MTEEELAIYNGFTLPDFYTEMPLDEVVRVYLQLRDAGDKLAETVLGYIKKYQDYEIIPDQVMKDLTEMTTRLNEWTELSSTLTNRMIELEEQEND